MLCLSCRHSMVVNRLSAGMDCQIFCDQLTSDMGRTKINRKVTECSEYHEKSSPARYELESIAWVLRTDDARKVVGFVHASKLKHDE